jgi:hypothetical protein
MHRNSTSKPISRMWVTAAETSVDVALAVLKQLDQEG